jgi:hypothetical protein
MEITELTDEQLVERLKRYEVDCPRSATRKEKEDLLQIAIYKYKIALEEKAKAQRKVEIEQKLGLDPQTKARPAPETIKIAESPKVYAVFHNIQPDGEGQDIMFNKGCTHTFHLWDGFLHVLPKCIIDECKDRNVPAGKRPIHGKRPHPRIPDTEWHTVIGKKSNYTFDVMDEKPPKNATFGVILDSKIYNKLNIDYPEPIHAVRPAG